MLNARHSLTPALLITLLLTACAKEESHLGSFSEATHTALKGSLEENVRALLKDDWREACDEKNGPRMLEITAALDARAEAIHAYAQSRPVEAGGKWKTVRLGPTTFSERTKPVEPSKGWNTTEVSSWDDIVKDYDKAKDRPVGPEWSALNSYVRGVLVDDIDRVVNGRNFALYQNMGSILGLMRDTVAACYKEEVCVRIPFSLNELSFIEGQPKYRRYLKAMSEASNPELKRKWVLNFSFALSSDLRKFTFRRNEGVRQVAAGVFEVPMDAGPFAEVSSRLREYIESVWAAPGRQVKVLWKDRASYPDIYRILLGENVGARAFVNHLDREMTVYPNVRSRSVAHETGHVLGFPDVYYTIWDPANCSYKTITHTESLMGDSSDGVVLPEHWAELEKQYPLK